MANLDGIRAKIARARQLQALLVKEAQPWIASLANTIAVKPDRSTGKHLVLIPQPPQAPAEWSVIFGEMLHDLRSALDHLAWQLVLLNKQRPTYSTQFPILSKPNDEMFDAQLRGVSEDNIAAIRSLQPYAAETRRPTHLEVLATLSNMDKHRTPHAGIAMLKPFQGGSFALTFDRGTQIHDLKAAGRIRPLLLVETELASFIASPRTSVVEVELRIPLSMELAFGLKGNPIPLSRTGELADEVERVLETFEGGFAAQ